MIIQPRKPQGPKPGIVTDAYSFMVALGNDKSDSMRHLEELKAALDFNQKLLADIGKATANLKALEQREKVLIENEARVDAKLSELQVIRESFKIYDADYNK